MRTRQIAGAVRRGLVSAVVVGACIVPGTANAALRAGQTLTIYAVPVSAQFMDHADDRIRGMSENPFTPNQETLIVLNTGPESKDGPFPGDDVLYSYKLYSNAQHTASVGSAFYTCYFNFTHNATCDANYTLGHGELVASGQITFNGNGYTLAVTGGSSKYLGASGEVQGTGAATAEVRLSFDVLPKSAKPLTSVTAYGVVNNVQYVNNADDEARGVDNNPFNARADQLRPHVSLDGVGPYAGDVAVYSLALYSNAQLRHSSGSGTWSVTSTTISTHSVRRSFRLAGPAILLSALGRSVLAARASRSSRREERVDSLVPAVN